MTLGKRAVRLHWLMTMWKTRENRLRSCNVEGISTCVSKTAWCDSHSLSSGFAVTRARGASVWLSLPNASSGWIAVRCSLLRRGREEPLARRPLPFPTRRLGAGRVMFPTFYCSVMSKILRFFGFGTFNSNSVTIFLVKAYFKESYFYRILSFQG